MPEETAFGAKPADASGMLYQRRAIAAFPILVRQAWAGHQIYYGEIARELGMSNPRNMNYVLGAVGTSIKRLERKWGTSIPPLQVLAINVGRNLPGEGFAGFLDDPSLFRNASPLGKRRIIEALTASVRAFPKWKDVLNEVGASQPPPPSLDALLSQAARAFLGTGGESDDHRHFKEYVAAHPALVGVRNLREPVTIEHCFPSGDAVDVLFVSSRHITAVEVKSRVSDENDILRGLFQCVKYRALLDAVVAVEQLDKEPKVALALEGSLSARWRTIATTLGIPVFENLRPEIAAP